MVRKLHISTPMGCHYAVVGACRYARWAAYYRELSISSYAKAWGGDKLTLME
jgi:hypothetical protein